MIMSHLLSLTNESNSTIASPKAFRSALAVLRSLALGQQLESRRSTRSLGSEVDFTRLEMQKVSAAKKQSDRKPQLNFFLNR